MNYIKELRFRIMPMEKYPDYLRRQGMLVGENCMIFKSAAFGSEPYLISLGNHVRVNSGVRFVTHDGGYWVLRDPKAGFGEKFKDADRFGRIIVHDNVHIGTNAIIMPGVEIGENTIVACGAVVTHDVSPNSVVAGVPARVIETLDQYAAKAAVRMVSTKGMTKKEKKDYLLNTLLQC